jgi:hypothetical protein
MADQNVLLVTPLTESIFIDSNWLASVADRAQDLAIVWLLRVDAAPVLT